MWQRAIAGIAIPMLLIRLSQNVYDQKLGRVEILIYTTRPCLFTFILNEHWYPQRYLAVVWVYIGLP
jgi:hypothetical protein